MTTALKCDDRQDLEMMRPESGVPLGITTTLYDLIWEFQMAASPGAEDTVVERIVSWMHAGRIRTAWGVQLQPELRTICEHEAWGEAIHQELARVVSIRESNSVVV